MVSEKVVKLYTDTLCPICKLLEQYLTSKGVKYTKINIDEDSKGKEAFLKLGYDNLPVLDVEGTTILGFNPEAIEEALKQKGIVQT
jgi:glutaredoxin 3